MRVWLAMLASGCAAPVDVHEAAIVGGTEPVGADATVVLGYAVDGQPFASACSGSLVAPDVVLTAKHCIPRASECRFGDLQVGFGSDGLDRVVGISQAICSDSRCGDGCPRFWNFVGEDVAVLVLAEGVHDVEPYEIPWGGDGLQVGAPVRLVGYGFTENATSGHKLEVEDTVVSYTDDELVSAGGGACAGDSGGSVLDADGRLVGIIARASDDDCDLPPPDRHSFSTRVTRWLDLVADGFSAAEACAPLLEEACNGRDDDCDAEIDEGCPPPEELVDAGIELPPPTRRAQGGCRTGGNDGFRGWAIVAAAIALRRRHPRPVGRCGSDQRGPSARRRRASIRARIRG